MTQDPDPGSAQWRDGWVTGQIEGACSAASELLTRSDPVAAARCVTQDLVRRFGARATKNGAFRDLTKRLPKQEATCPRSSQ